MCRPTFFCHERAPPPAAIFEEPCSRRVENVERTPEKLSSETNAHTNNNTTMDECRKTLTDACLLKPHVAELLAHVERFGGRADGGVWELL